MLKKELNNLVKIINDGNLIIMPTDTIYGIIGDSTNVETIKKVYEIKKRDYHKPLLILVSNLDMLKRYIKNINDLEKKVIKKYWPGKLTIIFEKNSNVNELLTSNTSFIGIRLPDNKDLINLINKVKKPLISTSANISNNNPITNVKMIEKEMKEKISTIIDGGEIKANSSTIVQVINNKIKIIREGDLSSKIKKDFKDYILS